MPNRSAAVKTEQLRRKRNEVDLQKPLLRLLFLGGRVQQANAGSKANLTGGFHCDKRLFERDAADGFMADGGSVVATPMGS